MCFFVALVTVAGSPIRTSYLRFTAKCGIEWICAISCKKKKTGFLLCFDSCSSVRRRFVDCNRKMHSSYAYSCLYMISQPMSIQYRNLIKQIKSWNLRFLVSLTQDFSYFINIISQLCLFPSAVSALRIIFVFYLLMLRNFVCGIC